MGRRAIITILLILALALPGSIAAQSDLAAVMTVQNTGVEVQRVGTDSWIPVSVEAIVGVGDTIRTDETGRAIVTYFEDGVDTTIQPDTVYRIDIFQGNDETFNLGVSVLAGQTRQRLNRALDAGSSYNVDTPGVNLVARGTAFDVRVEDDGRSAMLVTEGVVSAEQPEDSAEVPAQFGIRAEEGGELSDVVRASTFDGLDSSLDGCEASLNTPDDLRINVRVGASTAFPAAGTVRDENISNVKGVTENGQWYRIDFREGSGWLLASDLNITGDCAGLRQFEDNFGPEDITEYTFVGDPLTIEELQEAIPTDIPETDTAPANTGADTDGEDSAVGSNSGDNGN